MGQPWTRIGDITSPCPMLCAPGCIHGPETNVLGEFTVLVEKSPGCRIGDIAIGCGPPAPYVKGSGTVLCGKKPVSRIGDTTAHGSSAVLGAFTVLVGG